MTTSDSLDVSPFGTKPLIEWSPHLNLGIGVIDGQHKKLAAILNKISEDIHAGQGQKAEIQNFSHLIEQTQLHFKTEELLMKHHDYDRKIHHSDVHSMLIGMIEHYLKKYEEDANASNADLLVFLKDWLIEHIHIDDKPFGEFLVSKGVT